MPKARTPDKDLKSEDLQDFLSKWQRILKLQDWDVSITWAKPFEMGPDRGGEVTRCDPKKTALIRVLNEQDWDTGKITKRDTEYMVVHELMHLHFSVIDRFTGTDDTLYEQAIHAISTAILGQHRLIDKRLRTKQ